LPPRLPPPLAPRPARKSNGWKIATFLLIGLLVLMLVGFLAQSFLTVALEGGGPAAGSRLEEVTLEAKRSEHKIAVVRVEGIIANLGGPHDPVRVIKDQLKSARRDRHVKAVVLKVNSPGGEVMASDEISRAIAAFQQESRKPVVVSMGSLAASGGYYVAVPCRWIVANELTITGSIGVIMQTFNYRGLMDKVGLLPETFKSGKYKDMLSGFKKPGDITEQEREMVQNLVNETFDRFKTVVAEGRKQANQKNAGTSDPGRALNSKWADYADGRVLSGKQAFDLGFVDELGDFDAAVERAKKIAGIQGQEASLVEYRPVFDLSSLFQILGQSNEGRVKVDLGLELPKLQAGYLYFLSPTYVR
jgi:protease IV